MYTNNDTNKMTWEEYDKLMKKLVEDVASYFADKGRRVDIVAPIHRTGGIVGSMVAIRMEIVPMLPVQFKYAYHPTRIDQIISVPDVLIDVPEDPIILLCDGNTSSGSIAMQAAHAIHEKYPEAKIYLATLAKVFGCPDRLDGIEHTFYGTMTDEAFKANSRQRKEFHIREGITIFPWENVDAELNDINSVQ